MTSSGGMPRMDGAPSHEDGDDTEIVSIFGPKHLESLGLSSATALSEQFFPSSSVSKENTENNVSKNSKFCGISASVGLS